MAHYDSLTSKDNITEDYLDTCYDKENILSSDFPEVFIAGLACIAFNFLFFAGWNLNFLFELFKILWLYRPFSTANDEIMGTRNFTIKSAKESVVHIFSGMRCTLNHPNITYFIMYLLLLVRALVGPVIEWVHVFVDTKNYLRLINCEDVPLDRRIKLNRFALFSQLVFIVLGIMFLPLSGLITLRRHQEPLGSKRIKTFELVKADVTLCLSAIRVLCVAVVVDLPKNFIIYFYVEKFITSREAQGRSPAGYMTRNVSFLLIWVIAMLVVFFRARLNRDFFKCKNWYATFSRYSLFILVPFSWFFNQLSRTIGVFYQIYAVEENSLELCSIQCYPPLPDARAATGGEPCCHRYPEASVCPYGLYSNESFYEQDPWNQHCLNVADYFVIVTSGILLMILLGFVGFLFVVSCRFGGKLAGLYVNAIIDMGFPKDMNMLHVAAYYGHVQEVKELMASGNYDVNAQMEDGNTGLHLAASNGFGEVCYVLQKHYKAKIDIKNQDENVPEQCAELEGFELIRRYLHMMRVRKNVKAISRQFKTFSEKDPDFPAHAPNKNMGSRRRKPSKQVERVTADSIEEIPIEDKPISNNRKSSTDKDSFLEVLGEFGKDGFQSSLRKSGLRKSPVVRRVRPNTLTLKSGVQNTGLDTFADFDNSSPNSVETQC